MRYFIVLSVFILVSLFACTDNDNSENNVIVSNSDCLLKGKVKIIKSGSYDLKVKVVTNGSCDMYAHVYSSVGECHSDDPCGRIAFVDSGSYDVSVMFVENGSYDLSIRFDDERSYSRYIEALQKAKR